MESKYICLCFDTETSGLCPRVSCSDIAKYPYITQISFILYDTKNNVILRQYNSYIQQTVEHDYTNEAFQLTKITKEMCDNGVPITEALMEFYNCYLLCGTLVAHNLSFDKKMIQLELLRNYHLLSKKPEINVLFNDTFNDLFSIKTYCTMINGKGVTNLLVTDKNGNKWKKNPKLFELYEKLFDEKPDNLHNSLVDTFVCLKCYVKMKYNHIATFDKIA